MNLTKLSRLSLALVAVLWLSPAIVQAVPVHTVWNWTWTSTDPGYNGSGTLITDGSLTTPYGFSGYQITGITGLFSGTIINGLDSSFGVPDNFLRSSGLADNNILDHWGLSFDIGDSKVNLYDGGIFGIYSMQIDVPNVGSHQEAGLFSVTAVPEPSSFALLGIGGLVLGGYAWRKRNRRTQSVS